MPAGVTSRTPSSPPPRDLRYFCPLLSQNPPNVYTARIYVMPGFEEKSWPNPALLPEQESEDQNMATAKVFRSGNSQAVRLPKQFRLKSKEVEISRRGDEIVLREKSGIMARAFQLLAALPEDLTLPGRDKDKPQKRRGL